MNSLAQWFVDTSFLLEWPPTSHFFAITHGGTNAHHLWRFDPLTSAVVGNWGITAGVFWLLGLFGIGTAWLGRMLDGTDAQRPLSWVLAGLALSASTVLVLGFDVVALGGVAWLPLLVACLISAQRNPTRKNSVATGIVSALFCMSANQLALPCGVVCFLCAYVTGDFTWGPRTRTSALLVLIPAIFVTFSIPSYESPSLPPFSHYVSGYGTLVGQYALIGADQAEKSIDRDFVRRAYLPVAAALVFLLISLRSVRQPHDHKRVSKLAWTAFGVVFIIALDSSLLPPEYSQLAPLAAFSRIVPGLVFLPLTPPLLLVAFLFLTLAIGLVRAQDRSHWWGPAVFFGISVLGIALVGRPLTSPYSPFDVLRDIQRMESNAMRRDIILIVNSPSLYLLRMYGLSVLEARASAPTTRYTHILNKKLTLTASDPEAVLTNLRDARLDTRARLAAAPQRGGEWLHLRLESPESLAGIALPTAQFFSDFPRGIEVRIAESCTDATPDTLWTGYRIVASYPRWEGPVKFDDKGRPFFGPQAEVKVSFGTPKPIQCIAVIQRGTDPHFDWSAADIELGLPRNGEGTVVEQRL